MSTSYFVLWIPQIEKEFPHIIQEKLPPCTLHDKRSVRPLFVKACISPDSRDITFNYSIGRSFFNRRKKLYDKELRFQYVKQDERGFVIYRLDLKDEDNDFLCQLLRQEMPNAVYHYFKSFFHKHVFHSKSADSLLTPYFSPIPIKWNQTQERNNIVSCLIKDYETKYIGTYENLLDSYAEIVSNLSKYRKIRRMLLAMTKLIEDTRNTLNEREYCEFLLKSFPHCIEADKKNSLKKYINQSEKELRRFENLYNHISAALGLQFSVRGYYVGVIGLFVGLASSVGSLCYTAHQSGNSEEEIKKNIEELQNTVQIKVAKLEAEEQSILEQTQQMNSRLDSLTKEIHQMQRKLKK